MNATPQRLCLGAGIAMAPLFFVGFLLAHFLPPPAPSLDAGAVAAFYAAHRTGIRVGLLLVLAASALLAAMFALIGVHMRRIEGRHTPLTYVQLVTGGCLVLEFIFPLMTWQTAAFRPERDAATVQMLNDLGWLPFIGVVSTFILQVAAIGITILRDRRRQPVFPRWAGYLNLWVPMGMAPGAMCVLPKTGPLAWNGVLAFWTILVTFFIWFCVMSLLLHRAIAQQQREEQPTPPDSDGTPDVPTEQHEAEIARLRTQLETLAAALPGARR